MLKILVKSINPGKIIHRQSGKKEKENIYQHPERIKRCHQLITQAAAIERIIWDHCEQRFGNKFYKSAGMDKIL